MERELFYANYPVNVFLTLHDLIRAKQHEKDIFRCFHGLLGRRFSPEECARLFRLSTAEVQVAIQNVSDELERVYHAVHLICTLCNTRVPSESLVR